MRLVGVGVNPGVSSLTVSVSALSDRGVRLQHDIIVGLVPVRFSIRSFGSWGEAGRYPGPVALPHVVSVSALSDRGVRRHPLQLLRELDVVSVSALSDRGVRHRKATSPTGGGYEFQYPLFRIVG